MRIISIVVLVITASALAVTQVKNKNANQKTQVARENKYAKTGKGHLRHKILGRKTL